MEKNSLTLSFLSSLNEDKTLSLSKNMTLNEMKDQYSKEMNISPNEFNESFGFVYKGKELNLNSKLNIGEQFNNSDSIYVVKKENKKSKIKKNNQRKNKILNRQNNLNNCDYNYDYEDIEFVNNINMNNIKNTLEDMAVLGCIEKDYIEDEKINNINNIKSINECLDSEDDELFILGILSKYLENVGISSIIESDYYLENEEEKMLPVVLLQFIFNGYILKSKYILDFKLELKRLEKLHYDENESIKFNDKLKKILSKGFKIPEDEIAVEYYEKNPNEYSALVIFISDFNKELTKDNLLSIFRKDNELKFLSNVKKELIFDSIRLNRAMLDYRGNNKSDSNWGYNEMRGGEKYYPPKGWHRYGISVLDRYDNKNNDWLSYDNRKGEWCICYSGLSREKEKNYENDDDLKHPGKKVGLGVYVSPKPEEMEKKAGIINFKGAKYKMGLMLRIRPDKVRCPKSNPNIWVINGIPDEIRPYGILLKKI